MWLIAIDEAEKASVSVYNLIGKHEEEPEGVLGLAKCLHVLEDLLFQGILCSCRVLMLVHRDSWACSAS
jgi:hypothetical protein